jgi:hypothetical protein
MDDRALREHRYAEREAQRLNVHGARRIQRRGSC